MELYQYGEPSRSFDRLLNHLQHHHSPITLRQAQLARGIACSGPDAEYIQTALRQLQAAILENGTPEARAYVGQKILSAL